MSEQELKLCCCGTEPTVSRIGNGHTKTRCVEIHCRGCQRKLRACEMKSGHGLDYESCFDVAMGYATKQWNNRPIEGALQKRLDELEKENRKFRFMVDNGLGYEDLQNDI